MDATSKPWIALGRPELMNALRLGLAAWSAFAVATAFGIEHAFWASMPVWVVAQPWRGVVLERALWRLLGTALGGALGLALLMLSPTPWVTALVMAVMLAAGGGLMHLYQGVRSYLPLMTAITIAVVVIPAMLAPQQGLSLAVDRLACTLIGGIAVALIVGLFTPRAGRDAFRDEVVAFGREAEALARAFLAHEDAHPARPKLLAKAGDLEGRARLMAAGDAAGYRQLRAVDTVLAGGLAVVQMARVLADEGDQGARIASGLLDGVPVGAHLTAANPHLHRFAEGYGALQSGRAALLSGVGVPKDQKTFHLQPPRDPQRAKSVAFFAFVASGIGSIAILLSGSFAAELTAFSMAIFALVLGSTPFPQVFAPKVACGVVLGVIAGVIYRIGVQPHIETWPMLVLTIAPFIALGAVMRANPRTAPYTLDANMCFMLASQAGAAAVPVPEVMVSSVFMALGTVLMVLCYLALPRPGQHLSVKAEAKIRRALRALVARDVTHLPDWGAISGRIVMTLAIELAKVGEQVPRRVLAMTDLGWQVIRLRLLAQAEGLGPVCDQWLRQAISGGASEVPAPLRKAERIAAALQATEQALHDACPPRRD